jgi:hypothetical protein
MKLCRNIHRIVWQLWGVEKNSIAMVTKVHKMLNSLQASQSFAVMFPVTSTCNAILNVINMPKATTHYVYGEYSYNVS